MVLLWWLLWPRYYCTNGGGLFDNSSSSSNSSHATSIYYQLLLYFCSINTASPYGCYSPLGSSLHSVTSLITEGVSPGTQRSLQFSNFYFSTFPLKMKQHIHLHTVHLQALNSSLMTHFTFMKIYLIFNAL